MEPNAVRQAKLWLRKTEVANEGLKVAEGIEEIEPLWLDFLVAAGTIYLKLKAGAGKSGASSGWYGRKAKIRREDPLLRYIHQARNSDQHGIEEATNPDATEQRMPLMGGHIAFQGPRLPEGLLIDGQSLDPRNFQPHSIVLVKTVYDRAHGDCCDPPTSHLGSSLPTYLTPADVSAYAVPYLRSLVSEAESLIQQPR